MWLDKVYEASPSVQLFVAKKIREMTCKHILHRLQKQFGDVPEDLAAHLRSIEDQEKLDALLEITMDCLDLEAFRVAMSKLA